MNQEELKKIKLFSARIRLDVLKMLTHIGYGHLGGSMSIVELMSVLYGRQLRFDPQNPKWEDRDMVVLSKGHSGPAWYSALAESGFFDKEVLYTLNAGGTILPSHPDRNLTPGVDMTTGSLGQGTSAAAGIALAMKRLHQNDRYVYLICGDGELNEGQCWEAFSFIAHYKLNNCIVFIDENKRQLDGYTKDIIDPQDIKAKMESFGFHTLRVKGDDEQCIDDAINEVKKIKDQAVCIVLDTVKGQGVEYFEKLEKNHSVKFTTDELKQAADEAIAKLEETVAKGEQ